MKCTEVCIVHDWCGTLKQLWSLYLVLLCGTYFDPCMCDAAHTVD